MMIIKTKKKTYLCKYGLFIGNSLMLIANDHMSSNNGYSYIKTTDLEEFDISDCNPVIPLNEIISCCEFENINR